MDLLQRVLTRFTQSLIALMLVVIIGFSIWLMRAVAVLPGMDTIVLGGVIGLSTILIVLTLEFATTRIIKAIQDHPQAFAAEIKSQRSESRAMKTPV